MIYGGLSLAVLSLCKCLCRYDNGSTLNSGEQRATMRCSPDLRSPTPVRRWFRGYWCRAGFGNHGLSDGGGYAAGNSRCG